MSGVSKIEIHESREALLALMKQQKKLPMRERVQALYLLKSEAADSITHVARILGRNRITVQRWRSEYQQSGLKGLLAPKAHGGRPAAIPPGRKQSSSSAYSNREGSRAIAKSSTG